MENSKGLRKMNKFILITILVGLITAPVLALPTTQFAVGEFGEIFGPGGPGSASTGTTNGYIDAEDSFWSLEKAYHQGTTMLSPGVYLTEPPVK